MMDTAPVWLHVVIGFALWALLIGMVAFLAGYVCRKMGLHQAPKFPPPPPAYVPKPKYAKALQERIKSKRLAKRCFK